MKLYQEAKADKRAYLAIALLIDIAFSMSMCCDALTV